MNEYRRSEGFNILSIVIAERHKKNIQRRPWNKNRICSCLIIRPVYYIHFSTRGIVSKSCRHSRIVPAVSIDAGSLFPVFIGHVNLPSYFTSQIRYRRIHSATAQRSYYSFHNPLGRTIITLPSIPQDDVMLRYCLQSAERYKYGE
jgi:hypothetical protein